MTQILVETAQQVATKGDWPVSAPGHAPRSQGEADSGGQRSRRDMGMTPSLLGQAMRAAGAPVGTDIKVCSLCLLFPGRIG